MLSESPAPAAADVRARRHGPQSRSRLTHTASRLEKRGWVQREACVGDRRGVQAVLTPEGLEAITAMARVHVTSVREHLLDHLTPAQFAALGQAMEAIAAGIEAGGDCEEARRAQVCLSLRFRSCSRLVARPSPWLAARCRDQGPRGRGHRLPAETMGP